MTPRSMTRFATAVAGFALVAASCGGGSSDSAEPADVAVEPVAEQAGEPVDDGTAPEAAPAESTAAVPASLQFTAPLVGGGEIDATTLAGKPTAFWFWSPT